MSSAVRKLSLKLSWALQSAGDWLVYRKHKAAFYRGAVGKSIKPIETPSGERTRHIFKIAGDDALTTFGMHQRHEIIAKLYPEPLISLLDIGCCRGWFVLKAAQRPSCEKATGIDVVEGFIDAADEAKVELKLQGKVDFHYAFLDDVLNDPQKFRTPYQTVILINTYHYMYWGSAYSPRHWPDHEFLIKSLAGICTDRMIFMTPLEVDECPADIAERAVANPEWGKNYTTAKFLEIAGRYFDVSHHSYMGERPLYLMKRNTTPAL